MKIAFDAKRAFLNRTGLGNYSRTLIESIADLYPETNLVLTTPETTDLFDITKYSNVNIHTPKSLLTKVLKPLWRRYLVGPELEQLGIDIFHGLTNELPAGLEKSSIKKVVTVADLIFERFPNQYHAWDVVIYRRKVQHACKIADRILAMSTQTKDDLCSLYGINSQKIEVVYQSCHPRYEKILSLEQRQMVLKAYGIERDFFLYVGSLVERKNLLTLCEAFHSISKQTKADLVVVGTGRDAYAQKIFEFVRSNHLTERVKFLSRDLNRPSLADSSDLPAIYQSALALIFPSSFEGFGIPIVEAFASRLPVITSNVSSPAEIGGDASIQVNPNRPSLLADAMTQIYEDTETREKLSKAGSQRYELFKPNNCAAQNMKIYRSLLEI